MVMAVSIYCITAFLFPFHFFLWEFMSINLLFSMLGITDLLLHTLQVLFSSVILLFIILLHGFQVLIRSVDLLYNICL